MGGLSGLSELSVYGDLTGTRRDLHGRHAAMQPCPRVIIRSSFGDHSIVNASLKVAPAERTNVYDRRVTVTLKWPKPKASRPEKAKRQQVLERRRLRPLTAPAP